MKPADLFSEYKRLLKFGLIGFSGVFVNSGFLWLFVQSGLLPFYLCSFLAIEISIITNFLLNDIWTWSDRRRGHKLVRLLKYNLSTAFSSIFINMTVLLFFKEWIGLNYLVANLIGIGCGMLFNFLVNHLWTYGDLQLKLPSAVWLVLSLSLISRLLIAAVMGAGFDEAYYYAYSIRPALSYFDHPPFVGFLAGYFPFLTGTATAFTIRLGAILLFSVSSLILYSLARQFSGPRESLFSFILFNLIPLYMLSAGTMILPDAGLVFFWTLSLFVVSRIFNRSEFNTQNWILAGIFTGLAMLSKYHGIFLGMSVIVMLILLQPRQLLRPGPYVYSIFALIVFSPVILWNIEQNFVSFIFQSGRAVGGDLSINRLLQALGGQMLYLTPFIFLPLVWIMVQVIRRSLKHCDAANIFFTACGVLPVLIVLSVSLFRQILPHWTLPGYIILLVPFGSWLAQIYPQKQIVRIFSWFTVFFILLILIVAALHIRFGIFQPRPENGRTALSQQQAHADVTLDMYGWEEVGPHILNIFQDPNLFLFTHKWFLSGEMDLAVQGQIPVMCFNEKDPRGYGLWDARLDMTGKNGLFVCSSRYPLNPAEKYSEYFETISEADSLVLYRGGIAVKTVYFYNCRNLLKRYPLPYQ